MPEIDCLALDQVFPFSLLVRKDGKILHFGRSVAKALCIDANDPPNFFDIFAFSAPRQIVGGRNFEEACGKQISITASRDDLTDLIELRATFAPANCENTQFLVLTSLGTTIADMIEPLDLASKDFAYPDASVDLLYVLDSRNELMRNAQALNDRIEKAKVFAEHQARSDALTGLANRRALAEYAEHLRLNHKRSAYLFHIDLDRFKQINDRLGHAAGDAILKRVANDLRAFARPDDIIARIGGDEFVWVCTNANSLTQASALAEALIDRISAPSEVGIQSADIGASIGITNISKGSKRSFSDFLLEADLALYEVKKTGRGKFKIFTDDMMDREKIIQELIRDIEPAVEKEEFVPYFQTQIDCETGGIIGAEVLGRWLHPRHGLLQPQKFLYVAERAKLLEKIDLAIFDQALDQFAKWKSEGIAPHHLSLNLTAKMLTRPGIVERMKEAVERRCIDPTEVVFELLETILVDGKGDEIRQAAVAFSSSGFSLAIDDFGTGRASLTSLISVPVNLVKIDRDLVSDIHKSKNKQLLTEAIVDISKRLGLSVLAEGVETKNEFSTLLKMGCTAFQGYYFGRPASSDDFSEILRDQDWIAVMREAKTVLAKAKLA